MTDESPKLDKDAFACPRCDAFAHQEWHPLGIEQEDERGYTWFSAWQDSPETAAYAASVARITRLNEKAGDGDEQMLIPIHEPGRWNASTCGRCGASSVWRDERMVYPSSTTAPVPHEEMPSEARELYVEAREVVGISRRAGAALARASMERLLRSLDPDAGKADLAKRIDRILPKVSTSLGKMLTVIRHAGNKSLHVEDNPDPLTILVLDPEEEKIVEYIFTAINNLVDELITRPREADELYETVPQEVRDRVDKAKSAPGAK
jgi:hypothetical protein